MEEASLFIPTLPGGEDKDVVKLRSDADLFKYIELVRESGAKQLKKSFDKGGFLTKTVVIPPDDARRDGAQPAFFIVKYPVTIRTKSDNLCIVIYGLSPYPINADEAYCQK